MHLMAYQVCSENLLSPVQKPLEFTQDFFLQMYALSHLHVIPPNPPKKNHSGIYLSILTPCNGKAHHEIGQIN